MLINSKFNKNFTEKKNKKIKQKKYTEKNKLKKIK